MVRALLLAGAALALVGAAAPRDWTQTVVATPEGGFRMGNPAAPVTLVEYGSLACSHCAQFHSDSKAPLLQQVKSGRVSYEFRNYVLNMPDMAATVLSRCNGASSYFRMNDAYFSAQEQWLARYKAGHDKLHATEGLPPEQQLAPVAEIAGLTAIAVKAGLPAAKARQCLSDPAAIDRLVAMKKSGWATYRVRGTPTFIVNGKPVGSMAWADLAPLLKPPGS